MNGALLRLWLAVAVGACGFNGETADAPIGDDADGTVPDAPADSDPGDDVTPGDAEPDGPPDAPFCMPNATSCDGRVLSTCNADGSAITTTTCDLACSNGACFGASNLSSELQQACTAAAPVIAIASGETATIDRSSTPSLITSSVTVPATLVPSTGSEPALAVFCLGGLSLAGGGRLVEEGVGVSDAAVVLLVMGDVTIAGQLRIDGRAAGALIAGRGGMGGFAGGDGVDDMPGNLGNGPCPGRGGSRNQSLTEVAAGGGGGGGNGGVGGNGGNGYAGNVSGIPLLFGPGGAGGAACTAQSLVPLVGGSGGGSGGDAECTAQCGHAGGGGGGAIQIAASGMVSITGVVSAEGGAGYSVGAATDFKTGAGGGGGSGGSILVEAPTVSLGASTLRVPGGNGGSSQAGAGGAGAMSTLDGTNGTNSSTQARNGGAGAGGAAGRVRINTLASTECGQATVPVAACSHGSLTSQP